MAKKDSTDVFMTELDAYLFGKVRIMRFTTRWAHIRQ